MRRILARFMLMGAMATGVLVAAQAPAQAIWHFHSGPYPTATSCWNAGYYTAQYYGWEEYSCFRGSGPTWALMYWTTD